MVRKLFCAVFVMTVAIGFTFADTFTARIYKVDGDKVTYKKVEGKGKKAKVSETATTSSASGAKIVSGKFDPETKKVTDGNEVKGGLSNKMFSKINEEKGLNATITTEGDKITKIRVGGGKKKKKAAE